MYFVTFWIFELIRQFLKKMRFMNRRLENTQMGGDLRLPISSFATIELRLPLLSFAAIELRPSLIFLCRYRSAPASTFFATIELRPPLSSFAAIELRHSPIFLCHYRTAPFPYLPLPL
jgi:hypothetical protein